MSKPKNLSATEAVRMRIEVLRNYQLSVVHSGDQQLRVAMAEYASQFGSPQALEAA